METIFCRQAGRLAARGSHRIAGLVDTALMLREVQNRQVLASANKKERNHDSAACSQVTDNSFFKDRRKICVHKV